MSFPLFRRSPLALLALTGWIASASWADAALPAAPFCKDQVSALQTQQSVAPGQVRLTGCTAEDYAQYTELAVNALDAAKDALLAQPTQKTLQQRRQAIQWATALIGLWPTLSPEEVAKLSSGTPRPAQLRANLAPWLSENAGTKQYEALQARLPTLLSPQTEMRPLCEALEKLPPLPPPAPTVEATVDFAPNRPLPKKALADLQQARILLTGTPDETQQKRALDLLADVIASLASLASPSLASLQQPLSEEPAQEFSDIVPNEKSVGQLVTAQICAKQKRPDCARDMIDQTGWLTAMGAPQ